MSIMGWFFIGFGVVLMLFLLTMCILTAVAGKNLSNHRRRIFCLVITCMNCINVPLGTVLGVFTIIVLVRPSVKDLFEGKEYVEDEDEYDPEDDEVDVPPKDHLPVDPNHARRIRRPSDQ